MRVSVVINTCNRAASLRQTLRALRHQTCTRFEVIVVNGPSTDDTDSVLAEFAGSIHTARCPELHLSRSRNLGIALSSGDVVAFIDDDTIPEPDWLAGLLAAYDSERVGASGGLVYDHTGLRLQYRYAVCDRTGSPNFEAEPPFDVCTLPGADPFVYLQGTNCSFRRRCLVEIGGFDEEIEYYLDEVEVCLRVIDHGYQVVPLAGAAVHHKYLPSHLRGSARVVLNPYPLVKNRCYFALQNGLLTRSLRQVQKVLRGYADALRAESAAHVAAGRMDPGQRAFFLEQVERGLLDGTERGLGRPRARRALPPPDPGRFLPFPVFQPQGPRLTLCLIVPGDYPESGCGADEAAARGHEVHVVARSPDTDRLDFEDGIWVHRLVASERHVPDLAGLPWKEDLFQAVAVHRAVERLHARRHLDAVLVPGSTRLALLCALDGRLPTVLTEGPTGSRPELPDHLARLEGALPERLAALLAESARLPDTRARRAVERLLDPACFPVDHAAAVLRLWPEPDDSFVRGLFRLLLGRKADEPSLAAFARHLGRGVPRYEVVRQLALSAEARQTGLSLSWLRALKRAAGEQEPPRRTVPLLDRMRALATRLAWAVKRRLRRAG
ncbi:MAG: glycosyltransferase [Gemmataceae bacterium]|nr:glycosyltransferase [Gemmataceae bacterium]